MKALSLWQPWATLMALALKKIETRSWPTNYRGPLLIHAAKKDFGIIDLPNPVIFTIHQLLRKSGLSLQALFPRGGIIATVDLKECLRITAPVRRNNGFALISSQDQVGHGKRHKFGTIECEFGDYRPGRYMWITEKVRPFKKPIPYRGRQGLFEVPYEALRVCRVCGCSEFNACPGGCSWVEEDLCSECL